MYKFSTDNLARVFSKPENDYEGFKKFLRDYVRGKEVFDADGNKVTRQMMNDKVNQVVFDILELDPSEKLTKRSINRAMRKHGPEVFEVLEDAIDLEVSTGFLDNEFFNAFVDARNISVGDRQEFYTSNPVVLSVAKVAGDHHDLTMQKLAEGTTYVIPTSSYAVKVGMDIDVYLSGRKDWSELIEAVARSYQIQVQNDIFSEVMNAGTKIPANEQFNISKELSKENKDEFDGLISDVSAANYGAPVVIMGLRTDLKKLNALCDVDWIASSQKEQMAEMGRLGSYEGTTLIEIPQRFAPNDVTKRLITPGKLLIMPNVDNQFVKFVDVGETEIREVTEKGDLKDDFMIYEVQREMGVAAVIERYFGVWTISG